MSRMDPPTDEEIENNLMIQRKKQQINEKSDTKIEAKVNPISSFPVYPEYEEYPQKNDK